MWQVHDCIASVQSLTTLEGWFLCCKTQVSLAELNIQSSANLGCSALTPSNRRGGSIAFMCVDYVLNLR